MYNRKTYLELKEHIDWIVENKPFIIVEGKEDKLSLEKLGLRNIATINKPLYKIVEEAIEEEQVLLLTDLDKKGKQLYSKLNHQLNQFGVKINNNFREFLFRKTKLRQIEGLWRYYLRQGRKLGILVD